MTDMKNETNSTANPLDTEEMAHYGIARVPVDYFHYGQYRYSNLKDAIAEAEREGQVRLEIGQASQTKIR